MSTPLIVKKVGAFAAIAALTFATAREAKAFCGFYVGGADAKLFNNATQVVMMREGTRTVLSMQNNYEGPPEGFAMVVPVPVVLQKENVKTLPKDLFDKIDRLTSPRLVEYWEQDPCGTNGGYDGMIAFASAAPAASAAGRGATAESLGVTVEARFDVGEYDVVILSAKDSSGLDTYLKQEKYSIPSGAEPYLRPYVAGGSKFFVAKVDPKRVTFEKGQAQLSPLRFHYDSNDFTLPIRLGLINSRGTQDLIVNILANERYEAANYPNTTIPTNLDLAEGSKEHFGRFYAALFDRTVEKHPKAVVTEYSWDASSCDPCPGPAMSMDDFATLGADAVPSVGPATLPTVSIESVNGTGSPASRDLVAKRFKSRIDTCWADANGTVAMQSNPWGGRYYPPAQPTNSAKPVDRKPKLGHVDVKLAWGADGKIKDLGVSRNETDDKALGDCVKKAFEGGSMPPGEDTSMTASYLVGKKAQLSWKQWTITRLHARYSKDAIGEDIIFKSAKPIMGGREVRNAKGDLEHGATLENASINNFQGRYAVRHAWVGPLDCKEPKRGVWGGPWSDLHVTDNQPKAAEKSAFTPRGGVTLTSFVRTDVPELGVTAGKGPLPVTAVAPITSSSAGSSSAPADSDAGAAPPGTGKTGCVGCVVGTSRSDAAGGALVWLGVAFVLVRKRRR